LTTLGAVLLTSDDAVLLTLPHRSACRVRIDGAEPPQGTQLQVFGEIVLEAEAGSVLLVHEEVMLQSGVLPHLSCFTGSTVQLKALLPTGANADGRVVPTNTREVFDLIATGGAGVASLSLNIVGAEVASAVVSRRDGVRASVVVVREQSHRYSFFAPRDCSAVELVLDCGHTLHIRPLVPELPPRVDIAYAVPELLPYRMRAVDQTGEPIRGARLTLRPSGPQSDAAGEPFAAAIVSGGLLEVRLGNVVSRIFDADGVTTALLPKGLYRASVHAVEEAVLSRSRRHIIEPANGEFRAEGQMEENRFVVESLRRIEISMDLGRWPLEAPRAWSIRRLDEGSRILAFGGGAEFLAGEKAFTIEVCGPNGTRKDYEVPPGKGDQVISVALF
jgi:hypothetical protein